MTVGLGTASTFGFFLDALGRRVQTEGLKIRGVCTSGATESLAARWGIPTVPLTPESAPDLTVDGADELDDSLFLIKGGGGALLREKLVARASAEMVVIADATASASKRWARSPLPLAAVPFAGPAPARYAPSRIRGGRPLAASQRRLALSQRRRPGDFRPAVRDHPPPGASGAAPSETSPASSTSVCSSTSPPAPSSATPTAASKSCPRPSE